MIISNYYLMVDDSLKTNSVGMNLLAHIKNYKYLTQNSLDALFSAGFLVELSEADQDVLRSYTQNGYVVRLSSSLGNQDTILVDYPFLSPLFLKVLLDSDTLSPLELNTLYKLGFVYPAG